MTTPAATPAASPVVATPATAAPVAAPPPPAAAAAAPAAPSSAVVAGAVAPVPVSPPPAAPVAPAVSTDTEAGAPPAPPATPEAAAKPVEAAKPADVNPLGLNLPPGFKPDEGFNKFSSVAKEYGLDTAKAQNLFDIYAAGMKHHVEATNRDVLAQLGMQDSAKWEHQLKADPSFAKDFDKNLATARRAIRQFGDDELDEALTRSNFGNHPAFVKAFQRIGQALKEDTIEGTRAPPSSVGLDKNEEFQKKMYGAKTPQLFQTKQGA